jgi:hypothetical protein
MPTIQASTLTLTLGFPTSTCQLLRQTQPSKTPPPFPRFGPPKASLSLPKPPLQRASKLPAHHSLLTGPSLPRSIPNNNHRSTNTANTLMETQPSRIGIKATTLHKPDHPTMPQLPTYLFRVTMMAVTDPSPGNAILSTY